MQVLRHANISTIPRSKRAAAATWREKLRTGPRSAPKLMKSNILKKPGDRFPKTFYINTFFLSPFSTKLESHLMPGPPPKCQNELSERAPFKQIYTLSYIIWQNAKNYPTLPNTLAFAWEKLKERTQNQCPRMSSPVLLVQRRWARELLSTTSPQYSKVTMSRSQMPKKLCLTIACLGLGEGVVLLIRG